VNRAAEEWAMTDPDDTVDGLAEPGSDYGYDLAHDLPRVVRSPARAEGHPGPQGRRGPSSALTGGDYGYDEAHGAP
jgi:hypothetical protein